MAYPTGLCCNSRHKMLAVAGRCNPPPQSSPRGRAYPPNASTTAENCFPGKGPAAMIQVSLVVVRGDLTRRPKARYGVLGLRLDQSQEPLAGSVCHDGQSTTLSKAEQDLSGGAVKGARQLFHSGLPITTPGPDWLYCKQGRRRRGGTNTNHSFDSPTMS